MAFLEYTLNIVRKIHNLTHDKFQLKNWYRSNRNVISAILVFHLKFSMEFPHQLVDSPIVCKVDIVSFPFYKAELQTL